MNEGNLDKFDFLTGDWDMKSNIPKSKFSKAATGTGLGSFKKILEDNYVLFE